MIFVLLSSLVFILSATSAKAADLVVGKGGIRCLVDGHPENLLCEQVDPSEFKPRLTGPKLTSSLSGVRGCISGKVRPLNLVFNAKTEQQMRDSWSFDGEWAVEPTQSFETFFKLRIRNFHLHPDLAPIANSLPEGDLEEVSHIGVRSLTVPSGTDLFTDNKTQTFRLTKPTSADHGVTCKPAKGALGFQTWGNWGHFECKDTRKNETWSGYIHDDTPVISLTASVAIPGFDSYEVNLRNPSNTVGSLTYLGGFVLNEDTAPYFLKLGVPTGNKFMSIVRSMPHDAVEKALEVTDVVLPEGSPVYRMEGDPYSSDESQRPVFVLMKRIGE